MAERKHMSVREFVETGYLQELNRQFLHPLGLALEVAVERCGCDDGWVETGPAGATYSVGCERCGGIGRVMRLGGIWDERHDPEGIYFANEDGSPRWLDAAKVDRIQREIDERSPVRHAALGFVIQPAGELP